MRAVLRAGMALIAAGLGLGAAPASAQSVPQSAPPATSTQAAPTDTIGPRDLQNFSLGGTVTRRAEPAAPAASTPAPRATPPSTTAAETPARQSPAEARPVRTQRADTASPPPVARPTPAPATALSSPAAPPPQAQPAPPATLSLSQAAPSLAPSSAAAPTAMTAEPRVALWPWLLAAVALGAGGAFLLWRKRREEAFAGPQFDSYAAPQPEARPMPRPAPKPAPVPPTADVPPVRGPVAARAPAPAPAPIPAPVPQPGIPGTITTRLRPTIEMLLNPLRFIVEDGRIAVELEIELVNSGNAPARGVLIEAALINASNQQDQQIQAFFDNPVGEGQRIVAIPPMQRVALKTQVSIAREHVQEFEIAGKKVCVPLLALNALYTWNNSRQGQDSAAYLIGRDTDGGKLAPFRLDLGPRLFRGVGLRQLPNVVRK